MNDEGLLGADNPWGQACGSCVYFHGSEADGDGMCRRYPPTRDPGTPLGFLTRVMIDGWCGEWKNQEDGP